MYILYVMFITGLAFDIEEDRGIYTTMDSCWVEADKYAQRKDVFSVRCVLIDEKEK